MGTKKKGYHKRRRVYKEIYHVIDGKFIPHVYNIYFLNHKKQSVAETKSKCFNLV